MIRHSRHVDGATADFDLRCRLFFQAIDQWYWLFVTGAEHFGLRREIDSEAASGCLQHLGINLADCPDLDSALMAGVGGLCESARRLVDASSRLPESSTDRFESAWDLIQRAVYEELTWESPDGWLFSDNDDVVGRSAHDFAAQMAVELLELAGERAQWSVGEHEQWTAAFGDSLIEAIAELAAGLLDATIAIHEELRAQKCSVESLFFLPSDSDELFEVLLDAELAAAGDRSHRLLSVSSEIAGTQPSIASKQFDMAAFEKQSSDADDTSVLPSEPPLSRSKAAHSPVLTEHGRPPETPSPNETANPLPSDDYRALISEEVPDDIARRAWEVWKKHGEWPPKELLPFVVETIVRTGCPIGPSAAQRLFRCGKSTGMKLMGFREVQDANERTTNIEIPEPTNEHTSESHDLLKYAASGNAGTSSEESDEALDREDVLNRIKRTLPEIEKALGSERARQLVSDIGTVSASVKGSL